ncbi:MAG: hypothetical protein AB7G06_06820, partial [Bdellovibrionales bacterium]
MLKKLLPQTSHIDDYDIDELRLPDRALPFVLRFVSLFKLPLLAIVFCYLLATIGTAAEPYFFGAMVDALAEGTPDTLGSRVALVVGLYIIITQVFARSLFMLGHLIETHVYPLFTIVIRRHLARYLFGHSYRYFTDDFVGRLGGKVIEMPQAAKDSIADILNPFLYTIVTATTSIVMFSHMHWTFGATAGVYFVLIF